MPVSHPSDEVCVAALASRTSPVPSSGPVATFSSRCVGPRQGLLLSHFATHRTPLVESVLPSRDVDERLKDRRNRCLAVADPVTFGPIDRETQPNLGANKQRETHRQHRHQAQYRRVIQPPRDRHTHNLQHDRQRQQTQRHTIKPEARNSSIGPPDPMKQQFPDPAGHLQHWGSGRHSNHDAWPAAARTPNMAMSTPAMVPLANNSARAGAAAGRLPASPKPPPQEVCGPPGVWWQLSCAQ